jgi:hypothetical protein
MKSFLKSAQWLRERHRSAKFAILLVAAWAPFLLPHRPLWAGLLMTCASAVFLTATDFGRPAAESLEKAPDDPA